MRPNPLAFLVLVPATWALASDNSTDAVQGARVGEPRAVSADPARLAFVPPAAGQEHYRQVEKSAPDGEQAAIEIHGESGPTLTPIIEADDPPVESPCYVVRGRIKYENVVGKAHLEMWNDFGARGKYFTRTLADVGPMRSISGTSDWRDVELPFFAETGMKLSRLTVSVVMPGPGKILLTPFTIHPQEGIGLSIGHAWWDTRWGGWIGGIGGSALGILGAAIGILSGRKRAKPVVVALIAIGLAVGFVLLVAGVIALCLRQPFFVYYPLLLIGGITTGVLGFRTPQILRHYRDEEFRRIAALDG